MAINHIGTMATGGYDGTMAPSGYDCTMTSGYDGTMATGGYDGANTVINSGTSDNYDESSMKGDGYDMLSAIMADGFNGSNATMGDGYNGSNSLAICNRGSPSPPPFLSPPTETAVESGCA